MSVKENMEMFRTVVEEGFNQGNLGALDACSPPITRSTSLACAPPWTA